MALRYSINIKGVISTTFAIEIHDDLFVGAPAEISCSGASLEYLGQNTERWTGVIPSRLRLMIEIRNASEAAFLEDINASESRNIHVRVLKNGAFEWMGTLVPEVYSFEDISYPFTTELNFEDGLAGLKYEPYESTGGAQFNARQTVVEILRQILLKVPNVLTEYALPITPMLTTAFDWYEDQHPLRSIVNDPLNLTRINPKVFKEGSAFGAEPFDCYKVLQMVCEAFMCDFYHANGRYYFVSVDHVSDLNVFRRRYNSLGVYISGVSDNWNPVVIDQSSFAKMGGGIFDHYPGLKSVKATYLGIDEGNLLRDVTDHTALNDLGNVVNQAGHFSMILPLNHRIQPPPGGQSLNNTKAQAVYDVLIRVGNQYLTNAPGGGSQWTSTQSARFRWVSDPFGNSYTFSPISINTPSLQSTGVIEYQIEFVEVRSLQGQVLNPLFQAAYQYSVIPGANMQLKDDGGNTVISEKFGAEQTISTLVREFDFGDQNIADGPEYFSAGALDVSNGLIYSLSSEWRRSDSGTAYPIMELKVRTYLEGQTRPIAKMKGGLRGDIPFWKRVVWDNIYFRIKGGVYDFASEEWQLEAYALELNTVAIDGSVDPKDVTTSLLRKPGVTNSRDKLRVRYPETITRVTAEIEEGAEVTSISVEAISGIIARSGDTILVKDEVTGNFQEFEVQEDVDPSSTTISVVQEDAAFHITPDCTIQLTGATVAGKVNNPTGTASLDFGDLNDVTITNPDDGDLPVYNGTSGEWENAPDNPAIQSAQADASQAVSDAAAAQATADSKPDNFHELDDTNITGPSSGQIPVYDFAQEKWLNQDSNPAIDSAQTDATQAISDAAAAQATADSKPDNLSELGDVDVTGVSPDDLLAYDGISGKWEPKQPGGASGAGVPVGTVIAVISIKVPLGWLWMKGQTIGAPGTGADLENAAYESLFKDLLNTFPNTGNEIWGTDTITLPDTRGKYIIGYNQGTNPGSEIGSNNKNLLHSHEIDPDGLHDHSGSTSPPNDVTPDILTGIAGEEMATSNHTHEIESDGQHNHGGVTANGLSADFDIRPSSLEFKWLVKF